MNIQILTKQTIIMNTPMTIPKRGRPKIIRTPEETRELRRLQGIIYFNKPEVKAKHSLMMNKQYTENREQMNKRRNKRNQIKSLEKRLYIIWFNRNLITDIYADVKELTKSEYDALKVKKRTQLITNDEKLQMKKYNM